MHAATQSQFQNQYNDVQMNLIDFRNHVIFNVFLHVIYIKNHVIKKSRVNKSIPFFIPDPTFRGGGFIEKEKVAKEVFMIVASGDWRICCH